MEWDVFICHASEDKDDFARPLAESLRSRGLKVWFDEFTMSVGDSLRRSIDFGLAKSRYGVVIISPSFLEKEWPQRELDGLVAQEVAGKKMILPVWHRISADQIRSYSPTLADRVSVSSSAGLEHVIDKLLFAIGVGIIPYKKGKSFFKLPLAVIFILFSLVAVLFIVIVRSYFFNDSINVESTKSAQDTLNVSKKQLISVEDKIINVKKVNWSMRVKNGSKIKLRSGPGNNFQIIGTLNPLTHVNVTESVIGSDWAKVEFGEIGYGYLEMKHLESELVYVADEALYLTGGRKDLFTMNQKGLTICSYWASDIMPIRDNAWEMLRDYYQRHGVKFEATHNSITGLDEFFDDKCIFVLGYRDPLIKEVNGHPGNENWIIKVAR